MNPTNVFCPNNECPARGQINKGNIKAHSQEAARSKCNVCEKTFVATSGTMFYRLRTDASVVLCVIILLAYGCPVPAIVMAFGFDKRTVNQWWQRAGVQCQAIHAHVVGGSQLDLVQAQADEIKVKTQRGTVWMAMAMMVSSRLWLGGVLSTRRDKQLIRGLAQQIRGLALCRALLLAVDGLASYVDAFRKAFRSELSNRPGERGRFRLIAWPNIAIVQVVKKRDVTGLNIERRIVQGSRKMVAELIQRSQGQGVINTAFIERLNATFRQRLSCLTRRTRHLAQQADTLTSGMFVVGCFYNFCDFHKSLRLRLSVGSHGFRWVQRTPAIVAGLTDHRWSFAELLNFKVPPARWSPPKCRGRHSKHTLQLIQRWAA